MTNVLKFDRLERKVVDRNKPLVQVEVRIY